MCECGGFLHTVSPGLDILVGWLGRLETLKNQIMPFYRVNIVFCTHRDRKMDPGVAAWQGMMHQRLEESGSSIGKEKWLRDNQPVM